MYLAVLLIPLASCFAGHEADAQPGKGKSPVRRGTPAQIEAARSALFDGIDNVSRNPSAFLQRLERGTGCVATVSATWPEKADSVHQVQTFDAGLLSTNSKMSMLVGGVIELHFAAADETTPVARVRTTTAAGVASAGERTNIAGVTVLVAETSQQFEVKFFMKTWTDFVAMCGGRIDS